jgi:hypothetical protein
MATSPSRHQHEAGAVFTTLGLLSAAIALFKGLGDPFAWLYAATSATSFVTAAMIRKQPPVDAGFVSPDPAPLGGSEAKCEECGAYYPHHLTRNCKGEHVEPVK